jgi:hypothetical protein
MAFKNNAALCLYSDLMRLIVSGLPPLADPNHFHALFGRYVYGYKPWTHCDNCFVKRQESHTKSSRSMTNGVKPIKAVLQVFTVVEQML